MQNNVDTERRHEEHDIPKNIKELWGACISAGDGYYLFSIGMIGQLCNQEICVML